MERVADQVANFLADQGLKRTFGIPGTENLPLIESLGNRGVQYHLVAHETGAAFMADATAYLTNQVQACICTRGPGATNMVPGMASAHFDNSPVLAITGEVEKKRRERFKHQAIDLDALYAPLSKATFYATAETAGKVLPKAVSAALSEPMGAVRIGLSGNEATREAVGRMEQVRIQSPGEPDSAALDAVQALVRSAQRPFILLGPEVWRRRQSEAATRLAERLGAPVAVSARAKGVFPEDHPLFCGVLSMYQDAPIRSLIDQSDLVLAIGVDGGEFFVDWKHAVPVASVALVAPDSYLQPRAHARGDLARSLARLAEGPEGSGWGEAPARECREQIEKLFEEKESSVGAMSPQGTARVLRDVLPRDIIVTTDVGSHKLVMAQIWRAPGPGRFITSSVTSAMGGGIPSAVGASLERPDVPVVAVVGDAGTLMSAGELQTMARLGCNALVVVFNDRTLSSIKRKQEVAKYRAAGVEMGNPEFAKLAEAMGMQGIRAANEQEVGRAVDAWKSSGKPALLEIVVDYVHYRPMAY